MGRPITSARPTCSTSPRSTSVCMTPSTATPRTCSISARVIGWRYAMIARVSSAGCESRGGARFVPDQRLQPRREFRLGDKLPRARHANEPVAARRRFVFARQFFQRAFNASSFTFLKALTVSSPSAALAASASTSRSSLALNGFCAENNNDSKMFFSSMIKFTARPPPAVPRLRARARASPPPRRFQSLQKLPAAPPQSASAGSIPAAPEKSPPLPCGSIAPANNSENSRAAVL